MNKNEAPRESTQGNNLPDNLWCDYDNDKSVKRTEAAITTQLRQMEEIANYHHDRKVRIL